MKRIKLYEEYRLIEREQSEINGAWKGAHLILFFLAFVFGCACTFSFHILMYLFEEKCVLFPKLLSLTNIKSTLEGVNKQENIAKNDLPVDFVSTQWRESSTCYLPTYVPLVSGIFGLVWTTIFFMCSSGNRTMTGLQRPWRILPPIFIFSSAMGGLSVYSSYITHAGLQDLCGKLSEITGSKTCAYTVNIVTLAYERRIRGVYQATQLTIMTAWAHTTCWLLAAAVALARVLLVIDFRLVRIQAELQGDIEAMLEHYEQHIRTISPETISKSGVTATRVETVDVFNATQRNSALATNIIKSKQSNTSRESVKVRFVNKAFNTDIDTDSEIKINMEPTEKMHYISPLKETESQLSLHPAEAHKLSKQQAYRSVEIEHWFIVDMIYNLLDVVKRGIYDEIEEFMIAKSPVDSPTTSKPKVAQAQSPSISSREPSSTTTLRPWDWEEPKNSTAKIQDSKEIYQKNKAKKRQKSNARAYFMSLEQIQRKATRNTGTILVPKATTSRVPLKNKMTQTAKPGAVADKALFVIEEPYEDVTTKTQTTVQFDSVSSGAGSSRMSSRSDLTRSSERTLAPTNKDEKVLRIKDSDTSITRQKGSNETQIEKKEKQD